MSDTKLKRLVTINYKRPEQTYQDTLQNKKAMLEKLENYDRVDNIEDVSLKIHMLDMLHYIMKQNNKYFV